MRQSLRPEQEMAEAATPPEAPARLIGPAGRRRLRLLKHEVRRHVEKSIATNADPADAARLRFERDALLANPEVEVEFGDYAIGLIVLNACRDIQVKPDIRHWPDALLRIAIDADNRIRGLPPQPPRFPAVRRGPDPPVEKLPTGMIGTPGVPAAIDLPPWSDRPPPPGPPPDIPPPASRRPPGAYTAAQITDASAAPLPTLRGALATKQSRGPARCGRLWIAAPPSGGSR